jgi:hypothetical protein
VLVEAEIERLALQAKSLPPAETVYVDTDLIPCLLITVIDFQMQTKAVDAALRYFRDHESERVRTLGDLEVVFSDFPQDDREANTRIATFLCGYKLWTRMGLLRALIRWMRRDEIGDLADLQHWAVTSDFKRDFEGQVRYRAEGRTYGLGVAVYNSLIMRLGVESVKPDVRLRRFVEATIGRKVNDSEIVSGLIEVAQQLGTTPRQLDWAIWESQGARPDP